MGGKHMSLITLLLLIFSLSLTFLACSKNKVIVEIDKTKLTMDDFLYDIYLIEKERELWNKNYKESLGVDYWDYAFEGISMEQLSKDTIMTRVVLYEVLSSQAKREGYSLNKDELATTEVNVDKLLTLLSENELKSTDMNRDLLIRAFNKLALGDKYYMAVISDYEVDEESIQSNIDADEYREYRTECLYIPTAEVTYQKINPYGDDKLKEAYNKMLDIKQLIQNGADFSEVLEQVDGTIHYERNFILNDNTAEEEYKKVATELEMGEYSDVIITQFGYYIIHMLDNNSSLRYEKAIQSAIMDEKTALFKIHYDKLIKDYEITINSEYWDSLNLGSITYKDK